MPKIPESNLEQSENKLEQACLEVLKQNATFGYPQLICGVSRKVNTGNFENIDVYSGLSIPVFLLPQDDLEAFKQAVADAAELGFLLASKETGERYTRIKDLQAGEKSA